MPRGHRIRTADHLYHVTARGVARRPIFETDADFEVLLATLATVVSDLNWRCHAYCLMTNHYHLLLETPRANLPEGMQSLNGTYATRFNASRAAGGHVFQGRYSAQILRSHPHAMEVLRYIPLNPVRAGLCHAPCDWRWSSYRAHAGMIEPPRYLASTTVAWVGGTQAYRRFVDAGRSVEDPMDAGLRRLLRNGSIEEILCARDDCGYTLRQIARAIGVHHTTLARRLARSAPKGV